MRNSEQYALVEKTKRVIGLKPMNAMAVAGVFSRVPGHLQGCEATPSDLSQKELAHSIVLDHKPELF